MFSSSPTKTRVAGLLAVARVGLTPPMNTHSNTSSFEPERVSAQQPGRLGRWQRRARTRGVKVTLGLTIPILAVGLAACGSTSSSTAAPTTSPAATAAAPAGKSGAASSNARSTNAAGGTVGTVTSVASSSFTLSTPTGEKVTVNETSSTAYDNGTTTSTASAVTTGKTVLVLGDVNSTTVTASQVTVGPAINLSQASSAVLSFEKGSQSASKTVGQIPTDYTEGSGTIVSGTAATKATETALTDYAGGVVDRVVQLSNGEYEVHYIGVNWPHHIFVSSDFTVVGAN
jgi:hypothetical protein